MALTLINAGGEIDRLIGNREGDAVYAQAKVWANRAYQTILASRPFRNTVETATIATVTGVATVATPADFYSAMSLRDTTNDKRLIQIDQMRYDSLDSDTEGFPEYYALGDGALYLWRTPDGIYNLNLRYRKRLAEWTTDGDPHELPTEWDQVIVLLGASLGFLEYNELERASAYRNQALSLARAINDPLAEDLIDRNEPLQVRGLYGTYGGYYGY